MMDYPSDIGQTIGGTQAAAGARAAGGNQVGLADITGGQAVGPEQCRAWTDTLQKYKAAKAKLEQRIVKAEEYWKLRHWRAMRPNNSGEPEPASGWLVNAILSKHSDAVDAYPEPVCLAREAGDKADAKMLSDIIPVILQQNGFDQVWSDVWWYKLKSGTGVYGVFWDANKLGGLGDIKIQKVDILNLFWQPGVNHIQDSKCIFYVNLMDNEQLQAAYPQLQDKLGAAAGPTVTRYIYDDAIPTADKSAVVDVYYKVGNLLHYCKYVGETVLFATENEEGFRDRGLYDHGKYPFVFDPLFPEEGYPNCGYGYVDLCADAQNTVDILNNCFVQASVAAATPRWFVRMDGGVNEAEYADLTKKFVHVQGRLDPDSIMQIQTAPMPSNTVEYMLSKIDEIKQVSGNRDVNNGSSSSVTAASAIAALQEAGNGLSRDMISSGYRAFRQVVELCIELIRQFYTVPRQFRIVGQYGVEEYITYSNQGIQPQDQGNAFGLQLGSRVPVFDIEVEVQSESTYTKQAYNELAVQLYQLGIFNPNNAAMALTMLEMMDFKGRDELIRKVQANGMLQQQLLQWQQMAIALATQYAPDKAEGLAAAAGVDMQQPASGTSSPATSTSSGEDKRVADARENAAKGSAPR